MLLIMLSCNYMASYHSHFQYVQRLYVSLGIIHSSNMYQYKTRFASSHCQNKKRLAVK